MKCTVYFTDRVLLFSYFAAQFRPKWSSWTYYPLRSLVLSWEQILYGCWTGFGLITERGNQSFALDHFCQAWPPTWRRTSLLWLHGAKCWMHWASDELSVVIDAISVPSAAEKAAVSRLTTGCLLQPFFSEVILFLFAGFRISSCRAGAGRCVRQFCFREQIQIENGPIFAVIR